MNWSRAWWGAKGPKPSPADLSANDSRRTGTTSSSGRSRNSRPPVTRVAPTRRSTSATYRPTRPRLSPRFPMEPPFRMVPGSGSSTSPPTARASSSASSSPPTATATTTTTSTCTSARNPQSIDLTPGTTSGALFDGMTADGSTVYFTTPDPLTTASDQDSDTSADIFRADVTGATATLTRVTHRRRSRRHRRLQSARRLELGRRRQKLRRGRDRRRRRSRGGQRGHLLCLAGDPRHDRLDPTRTGSTEPLLGHPGCRPAFRRHRRHQRRQAAAAAADPHPRRSGIPERIRKPGLDGRRPEHRRTICRRQRKGDPLERQRRTRRIPGERFQRNLR